MADLERLRELISKATPGRWRWFGNTRTKTLCLATERSGRRVVMGFDQWGSGSAAPLFQRDGRLVLAPDLVRYEAPHRDEVAGIDHPDAELIPAAVNALPELLERAAELDALRRHLSLLCDATQEFLEALEGCEFLDYPAGVQEALLNAALGNAREHLDGEAG